MDGKIGCAEQGYQEHENSFKLLRLSDQGKKRTLLNLGDPLHLDHFYLQLLLNILPNMRLVYSFILFTYLLYFQGNTDFS